MRKYLGVSLAVWITLTSQVDAGSHYVQHDKGDTVLGEATHDTALLYVVRPGLGHAKDETWWFLDEQVVGLAKAPGYSFALVPEGTHLFWMTINVSALRTPRASTPSVADSGLPYHLAVLELEFERGKTYYLEVVSRPGVSGIVALDEEQGKMALEECSYFELTSRGRERGAQLARKRLAEAQRKAEQQRKKAKKTAKKEAKRAKK